MQESDKIVSCFHCGSECKPEDIFIQEKHFCCIGCKNVYQLLNQNDLDYYYCLNETPGDRQLSENTDKFNYLDEDKLAQKLITFKNHNETHVVFSIPQMHCSSCLYLLENLKKLNRGVIQSSVNFTEKKLYVSFKHHEISLKQLANMLYQIGYEPHISIENESNASVENNRSALIKLGVAGFCFANIMMASFPEYLGMELSNESVLTKVFRFMNLLLSIPIIYISWNEFFVSAYRALKQKIINIDAPVSLAIIVTFGRSLYDVFTNSGSGFFDSMAGIVFFMLIGRFLQNKTHSNLNFNRNYKSYFPIAVENLIDGKSIFKSIDEIKADDVILLKNGDVIPVDAVISRGKAQIDYSYITGEQLPEQFKIGDLIYSGGIVRNGQLEIIALSSFDRSKFVSLWNNKAFESNIQKDNNFIDRLAKNFGWLVLFIALSAFIFWQITDPTKAWNVFTSVLIIACPCALLLSSSFINGFVLQMLSSKHIFVKNADAVQNMASIDCIVFDKTGTLTEIDQNAIEYQGEMPQKEDLEIFLSLMAQSKHPLSLSILNTYKPSENANLENFAERPGLGMECYVNDKHYKLGSAQFMGLEQNITSASEVWLKIDETVLGHFIIKNKIKEGGEALVKQLQNYDMYLLSGDKSYAKSQFEQLFPDKNLWFNQSPIDKLNFIKKLQAEDKKVMMVGDGLNDAGALRQSNVGIALTKGKFAFTPASEVIIDENQLDLIPKLIQTSIQIKKLIIYSLIYSIVYNLFGLYMAITGQLQPIICAIIMPLSSISLILIAYFGVQAIAHDKNHGTR